MCVLSFLILIFELTCLKQKLNTVENPARINIQAPSIYFHQPSQITSSPNRSKRVQSLPRSLQIERMVQKVKSKLVLAEECSICLVEFTKQDRISRLLVCGHEFHQTCILNWMWNSSYCPLCRLD